MTEPSFPCAAHAASTRSLPDWATEHLLSGILLTKPFPGLTHVEVYEVLQPGPDRLAKLLFMPMRNQHQPAIQPWRQPDGDRNGLAFLLLNKLSAHVRCER